MIASSPRVTCGAGPPLVKLRSFKWRCGGLSTHSRLFRALRYVQSRGWLGSMPRTYHSPSSISLVRRCAYAAARQYIDGVREPGTAATDFGGDFHAIAEAYYGGEETRARIDWTSKHAKLFLKGTHLSPNPVSGFAYPPTVEGALGSGVGGVPMPPGESKHAPPTMWKREGGLIYWAGLIDLEYEPTEAEANRLGLPYAYGAVITQDWKTCGDYRYALTEDAGPRPLKDDLQSCIYALEKMERMGNELSWNRWVYFPKNKGTPSAVLTCISYEHAQKIVDAAERDALEFDKLQCTDDAPKNPGACYDYGRTCSHHHTQGGPCNARGIVPIKNLFAKELTPMTDQIQETPAERLAKIRAAKQASSPGKPPAEATPAEEAPVEEPAAPVAPHGIGNPKPRATKPKAAAPAAVGGGALAVLKLAPKLEKAQEKLTEAQANVDAVLAEIAAAAKGGA